MTFRYRAGLISENLAMWNSTIKIFGIVGWLLKGIIIILMWFTLVGASFIAGFFTEVLREMPLIEKLNVPNPSVTSRIYDSTGKVLLGSLFSEENRILVSFKQIPDDLKNAIVAVEDKTYYQHKGVSPRGIARAAIANLQGGAIEQGASTITMQLTRNLYFSREKTWRRKILEMLVALKLEQRFSKDEILTFYLNEVSFGRNTNGVEAASQSYFGKHVSDLDLAECAMLAGLPQRPSAYAPSPGNTDAAEGRREVVLKSMLESGFISPSEYEAARVEPIEVLPARATSYKGLNHPYFTTYVINEVKEIQGGRALLYNGLNIYTTIDVNMQSAAERILPEKVAEFAGQNVTQGALMTMDPKTGAVLAIVGGVDFDKSELNRAWQAHRQPGSSFKPFVYLKALEKGYSPSSLIVDEKVTFNTGFDTYTPNNYDHEYLGVMTAREALARSRNVCAVKVIDIIGPGEVVQLARRLGFESTLYPYLSLALGSGEVTMQEMCAAYSTFANDGEYNEAFSVLRITDTTGRVIYERKPDSDKVVDSSYIRLLNSMLQSVVTGGTGTRARISGYDIAGKTGTTSEYSDAWFIGYTPNLCTAVWVGNDKVVDFMKRVTGGVYPAVIWHDYMVEALNGIEPEKFPPAVYPGRVKPLDKERTNAELEAMLGIQEAGEEVEGIEAGGEFRHPWEIETSHGDDSGGDEGDEGDEGEKPPVYF